MKTRRSRHTVTSQLVLGHSHSAEGQRDVCYKGDAMMVKERSRRYGNRRELGKPRND